MSFREQRKSTRYYKAGINVEELKKKREDESWRIRKNKRETQLRKRRNIYSQEIDQLVCDPNHSTSVKMEDLPRLAQDIRSSDVSVQYNAIVSIKQLLIDDNPPIAEVLALGIVQDFVHLLIHSNDSKIQYNTAWALSNIATGTNEQTKSLLDYGAVPAFISILNGEYEDSVKDQAIWALGNIAADSTPFRDFILGQKGIDGLIHAVTFGTLRIQITGVWCISILCQGKPSPSFDMLIKFVPTLYTLIKDKNVSEQVKIDACWSLAHITDIGIIQVTYLLNSKLHEYVLPLLSNSSEALQTPIIRIAGNISTGDQACCQLILDYNCLLVFKNILSYSHNERILREVCWTISNIAAGTQKQIQKIIDTNGLIDTLVNRIIDFPISAQKEGAWIITNIASEATAEQIQSIVRFGVIQMFSELLCIEDQNLILIILEGLEYICNSGENIKQLTGLSNIYLQYLEEAGGLSMLYRISNYSNSILQDAANRFLEMFEIDDDGMEDELIIPSHIKDLSF